MKRILALTLAAAMLLGGCGKLIPGRGNAEAAKNDQAAEALAVTAAETTAAPTTEPTTVPTEPPVYRNPVNGQLLDAPLPAVFTPPPSATSGRTCPMWV